MEIGRGYVTAGTDRKRRIGPLCMFTTLNSPLR